ncbi:glycosyltransferase involved in cell wall biosynthesis [Microbacterium thalassium]|uniref:Glycosyltransferase involved in cell wall biosynthesis n=1 Tax=Microbacterium thalassium TaxID=362649 RepID=A0A7X0FQ34_9MICO|nr:glycosyltransferase involved in cell wall biosynthesis [Microbacterium thalassium]GLK23818.1 hypothetical protein GCM10017607_11360 [Microbacterium thalassium]
MRVHVVFPVAPPRINGIGDHSAVIAIGLGARGHQVTLVSSESAAPISGIGSRVAWHGQGDHSLSRLIDVIVADAPDAVVLQFEQFAYGARGFNPRLAWLPRELRRRGYRGQFVLFAHESYATPAGTLGSVVMWAYQRAQFRRLVSLSDSCVFTSDEWARRARGLAPRGCVVPVFSNIPVAPRGVDRSEFGLASSDVLLAVFGGLDAERAEWLRQATSGAVAADIAAVYVGRHRSLAQRALAPLGSERVRFLEGLAPEEVGRVLASADLALAPFPRSGVDPRRSSVAAFLANGVPVVTTIGPSSGSTYQSAWSAGAIAASDANAGASEYASRVVQLIGDRSARTSVGERGAQYYEAHMSPRNTVDMLDRILRDGPLGERARSVKGRVR